MNIFVQNTRYYHSDHLGTPQKLTDSTGTVVWSADYKPFGEATITVSTITNNLRYPGMYFDAETGLHYNYFRHYNPATGRYPQADPIGQRGGFNLYRYVDSVEKPIETNLYSYTFNNLLKYIDPLGLWGVTIGLEGAGGISGFGGMIGIYGNFAHDPSRPWYSGWSSSATFVLGGGAMATVYGLTGGVHGSANNACNVSQLNEGFVNAGRMGLGALGTIRVRLESVVIDTLP